MTCPNCHLENPAGASSCDCGYSFSGVRMPESDVNLKSIADSIRIIKNVVVAWAVLSVVGAVVWSIAYVTLAHEVQRGIQGVTGVGK